MDEASQGIPVRSTRRTRSGGDRDVVVGSSGGGGPEMRELEPDGAARSRAKPELRGERESDRGVVAQRPQGLRRIPARWAPLLGRRPPARRRKDGSSIRKPSARCRSRMLDEGVVLRRLRKITHWQRIPRAAFQGRGLGVADDCGRPPCACARLPRDRCLGCAVLSFEGAGAELSEKGEVLLRGSALYDSC